MKEGCFCRGFHRRWLLNGVFDILQGYSLLCQLNAESWSRFLSSSLALSHVLLKHFHVLLPCAYLSTTISILLPSQITFLCVVFLQPGGLSVKRIYSHLFQHPRKVAGILPTNLCCLFWYRCHNRISYRKVLWASRQAAPAETLWEVSNVLSDTNQAVWRASRNVTGLLQFWGNTVVVLRKLGSLISIPKNLIRMIMYK